MIKYDEWQDGVGMWHCGNTSDLTHGSNDWWLPARYLGITPYEFAKIIDDYFSMYGYKINEIGIPNITGRENWNYVKTINCNFDGDGIPQTDMETIRKMFDNGVTFWHNPSTMYNYNNSNNIV